MAKARTAKLKVFRTPIGFHDAYVAAPSQKAALEAWGSDSNLFAAGAAEQVTEADLMEVPLARPGEVIKVLRGSKDEQVSSLEKAGVKPAKTKTAEAKRPPKPSRAAVDEVEDQLDEMRRAHAKEAGAIAKELAELERRRRELERRHSRERGALQDKAERERARYDRELAKWKK
ncbi:MAG TPA: hypothetical protein VD768_05170 [Sphingomicrobium sp.]|nr:hypothetical protein [Sphingomicrobium sp.]